MLVWARLNQVAYTAGSTIYQLKRSLLGEYIKHELRSQDRYDLMIRKS